MAILDRFSAHAASYARYRIDYPAELFAYILAAVPAQKQAWDCATGNGQVATALAVYFEHVEATDISQQQLDEAPARPNVRYRVSPAEHTPFADRQFDLVTVGQALHWFDVDAFHREVRRVLRPGGVVAEWGYGLCTVNPTVDGLVRDFYTDVIGAYWDAMRRHVENRYAQLPFDFADVQYADFTVERRWTAEWFLNYLRTWSAVRKFIQSNGYDPVDALTEPVQAAWGAGEALVQFPVFLRLGRNK
ncbi:class I SAM-dependent methyltransferase [Rudanella lutea]|uniref:class I SAM-dependent methyltransferase n=1 Tax=Rudanella lutea TaxID=451374 RepID=UPI0003610C77|nr:class I SAM-dependent methyltransferase [Rudanella lutea]